MKKAVIYWILLIATISFIYLSINAKGDIGEWVFSVATSISFFFIVFKYFLDENKQINDHYLNSNITHTIFLKLMEFW